MLWSTLAVILLGVSKAVAGDNVASAEPFEVNAVRSQEGRFDYVAQVFANAESECTGTLISSNVVMTSAHCFGYSGLQSLIINATVQFGSNLTVNPTRFPATPSTAVALHPWYKRGEFKYDIALIRIDPTNFTGPPPTSLPTPIKHIAHGPILSADYSMTVTSLGWGNTDPTDQNSTLFLRNVDLTLTDPTSPVCQGLGRENILLQDGSGFCMVGAIPTAEELGKLPPPSFPKFRKGFCNGDSGGPTIVQGATSSDDVLIGINTHLLGNVATGVQCGSPLVGDVSTSVGEYVGFVQSMLQEFQEDRLPAVNITNIVVSRISYGNQGFGNSGLVTFLVQISIQTNYLMERIGVFDLYGPQRNPGFALRSIGVDLEDHATTILPFNIVGFDAPSFTYILEAINYQVVADFSLDYISGQLRVSTILQILFRPLGKDAYTVVVAEVSSEQLKTALCGGLRTSNPLDAIFMGIFKAFCLRA